MKMVKENGIAEARLWPQLRNGTVCPQDGTLMINKDFVSICGKCGRTHEGHLVADGKGKWVLRG